MFASLRNMKMLGALDFAHFRTQNRGAFLLELL
jgi:hypothetical protein